MNKKLKLSALAVAAAAVSFAFTANAGLFGGSKETVRISHTQIESHPQHLGLVEFKKAIEAKLGDKFDVQIFPNSTLGANEKVLELIKQGSVQFLSVSTANIESFDKRYKLFSIPYLFTSEKAFESFISDPAILKELGQDAKTDGFEPMTAFTAGTRNFYCKTAIKSVADLNGKKFRVQAGPTNVDMMNAFGAAAAPMSFGEVYSALQQGVIDGAENNELALTDQKHGEVAKFFSYDMHQMCPDLLVGSEVFLSKLSPEDRKVFDEAAATAQKAEFAAWHKRVEEAKKTATDKMGVTFIDVNVQEFQDKVLPLHEKILNETPVLKPLYEKAAAANKAAK
ncbi:MAG: TRAP transporter substrate-binding protein [Succinivibrionaceae bacterium]|nr:TRAP transporter substrate-binding protein [Succinivibrionaceae bacterium]